MLKGGVMKTKMVIAKSRHWINMPALGVVAVLALVVLVLVPAPAAAQCDQLFAKYEGSSWWWGAFGNCKKYGGTVDRNAIFECAWKQVPAPENTACLKERLRTSASTKKGIDAVVAYNLQPPPSVPHTDTSPTDKCPKPISIEGRRYAGRPHCYADTADSRWDLEVKTSLDCDEAGYFCCYNEYGANSRCGNDKGLLMNLRCPIGASLIQPYGCYYQ